MTYCQKDFEDCKEETFLLPGLSEAFMEEVAFEMGLKG